MLHSLISQTRLNQNALLDNRHNLPLIDLTQPRTVKKAMQHNSLQIIHSLVSHTLSAELRTHSLLVYCACARATHASACKDCWGPAIEAVA